MSTRRWISRCCRHARISDHPPSQIVFTRYETSESRRWMILNSGLGNGIRTWNGSQDIRLGTRWGQQRKRVCYILASTHAYTIVHIFPTLLESIPASKCGHTYITHELGAEALNGLAHAGLSMSESQVHKYTPESTYIVNTLGPRLLEKEALTA